MTSAAVYCQFTHLAIACDLTGRQMQLWLRLYELLRHRQDVQLNTSMLLRMLDTSRSQFQRARQALIDQGFLAIRQNRQQQTSYTLLLDGREIASASMDEAAACKPLPDTAEVRQALARPLAQKPQQPAAAALPEPADTAAWSEKRQEKSQDKSQSSDLPEELVYIPTPRSDAAAFGYTKTPDKEQQKAPAEQMNRKGKAFRISPEGLSCQDVILNRQYRKELDLFAQAYPDLELQVLLYQWGEMRAQNGWSLTQWGLWTILEKLAATAEDCIDTMIAMVRQSIQRRWKSFFPVKPEQKPSGKKLRQLEEKEKRDQQRCTRHQPWHKYKQEQRDLSFLEK